MLIPYQVDVPMVRWPVVNMALLCVTVLYYFVWQGDALAPADTNDVLVGLLEPAYDHPLILTGWNLSGMIGHTLLHSDVPHLLGNMIFLWVFGNSICAKLGNSSYLFVYAGLAWLAAAVQLSAGDGRPGVGASGAISGVVGMFLVWFPLNSVTCFYYFYPFYRHAGAFSISSYWMILLWLVFDILGVIFGVGNIGYWAHIGGFIGGVGLATLLLQLGIVEMGESERSIYDAIAGR